MKELYTAKEVAAILKISVSTIYVMLNKGMIESVKLGDSRRFTEAQIEKFIKKNSL